MPWRVAWRPSRNCHMGCIPACRRRFDRHNRENLLESGPRSPCCLCVWRNQSQNTLQPGREFTMSMLTNLDLIRRVPLFSMLTNDQAQAIADSVVKRRFRRGELVVEQGRKSNTLFILLNGRARVLTSDSRGREVILAVLESGDYVGEMSLIDNEAHSATVRCEIQTDMLILGRADFARCLPEHSSAQLRHPARPGAAPAPCRPADRIAGPARCVRPCCSHPAGDVRRHQRRQDHPQQGLAPGHGQGGGRLARDGQPGDEGPGRARRHRDAGERLGDHQGTGCLSRSRFGPARLAGLRHNPAHDVSLGIAAARWQL